MPRHLATLLSAAVLVMAGCDSAPPPGNRSDAGTDAGPDAGIPWGMWGRPTGGQTEESDGGTSALVGPSGGTVRGCMAPR